MKFVLSWLHSCILPNLAATAAQTGIAKFSDSRSWNLGTINPRHQKSSPNRRFLPEKSLLYMCSVAAILLLEHNLNLVPVLFALKRTDLCSHSPTSMNLRMFTQKSSHIDFIFISCLKLGHKLLIPKLKKKNEKQQGGHNEL